MADYTPDDVQALICLLFDEDHYYGPVRETRPDGDMPKGCSPKATQGTWIAELADIRRAWKEAPLSLPQRRRLFLCYGNGWRQSEAAIYEGVTRQAVALSLDEGTRIILRFLNGKEWVAGV